MLGLQSLHTLLIDTRVMKILNLMNSLTGLELLQKWWEIFQKRTRPLRQRDKLEHFFCLSRGWSCKDVHQLIDFISELDIKIHIRHEFSCFNSNVYLTFEWNIEVFMLMIFDRGNDLHLTYNNRATTFLRNVLNLSFLQFPSAGRLINRHQGDN